MKDLLLGVHVVAETLNLDISRYHLADYVKECYQKACRTCSTVIFPYLTNQTIVFWRCICCCRLPKVSLLRTRYLQFRFFDSDEVVKLFRFTISSLNTFV